jgi:hypothetical protein
LGAWDLRKPDRKQRRAGTVPRLPATCRDCGVELPNRRVRLCPACRAERFERQARDARERGLQTLAALRSGQQDPAHGGRAGEQRGQRNREHQQAIREWDGEVSERLTPDLLAVLRRRPLGELAAATGLSAAYVSRIRLGKVTPHPRWWPVLREIAEPGQR